MAFDVTQLNTLVQAVSDKENALADATTANNTAQATASSAVAAAAQTTAAQTAAHSALSDAVDALVAYATSLKN